MGQLQKKTRVLLLLYLAANIILETAFLSNNFKEINSKSMLSTLIESDPVALLKRDAAEHHHDCR